MHELLVLRLCLLAGIIVCSGRGVHSVTLYPYGATVEGETVLGESDEGSSEAVLLAFPFYGAAESSVYVSPRI